MNLLWDDVDATNEDTLDHLWLGRALRDVVSAPRVVGGSAVAAEVTRRVMQRIDGRAALDDVLCETLYREEQRLAHADSEPHTARDRAFIKALRHSLAHAGPTKRRVLVERTVGHYAREITGHFDRRIYAFTTSIVPSALGALLHGGKPSSQLFNVDERVLLEGDVPALQRAAHDGTVVLVPTHVSNLDSLILGHAIYRLGLPPFAYGAGLNLFSHALIGFFMRHLGAFTVDRKKSDPLYIETVKEYAGVLLEHGQHMLFFPGGTRSRSGVIESHLKLGFLGQVVAAFVNRRIRDPHSPPLFIVPCTLSYPIVLEGASLIEEYLSREGGPHFVDVRDEFERPARWLGFLRGLAELDVQVHVRFGSPLDPLGNAVDARGVSRDGRGRPLDPTRYLLADGAVVQDAARDAEYTKALAQSVLASFKREAVALPSSVLAFALFTCLQRKYPRLDLFRFLRVLGPSTTVSLAEVEKEVDVLLEALRPLAERGAIQLAPVLAAGGKTAVIEQGALTLGAYHRPPALVRHADRLEVTQPTLLLYYRNRLEGFGLPGSSTLEQRSQHAQTWGAA